MNSVKLIALLVFLSPFVGGYSARAELENPHLNGQNPTQKQALQKAQFYKNQAKKAKSKIGPASKKGAMTGALVGGTTGVFVGTAAGPGLPVAVAIGTAVGSSLGAAVGAACEVGKVCYNKGKSAYWKHKAKKLPANSESTHSLVDTQNLDHDEIHGHHDAQLPPYTP